MPETTTTIDIATLNQLLFSAKQLEREWQQRERHPNNGSFHPGWQNLYRDRENAWKEVSQALLALTPLKMVSNKHVLSLGTVGCRCTSWIDYSTEIQAECCFDRINLMAVDRFESWGDEGV